MWGRTVVSTPGVGISTDQFVKIGNNGRSSEARDKGSSPTAFYNWMLDCRRLLLSRDEVTWLEKQTVPHFSGFLNTECACGGDPAKCNTGRATLSKQAEQPAS